MNSKHKISTCLWFDSQAEEAANFYVTVFKNSRLGRITRYGEAGYENHKRPAGSVMTVDFEIDNHKFTALNGGPLFDFTPALSYSVTCETESEVRELWEKLSQQGSTLMKLDKYDWSELYGWVKDRYGLTWQICIGKIADTGNQKITPSLMFSREQQGKAEDAIKFYTSIFKNSSIEGILKYDATAKTPGQVMHAQFKLLGETFMAMDSGEPQDFTFNEAASLMVNCTTQQEIDYFWRKLTPGGDPKSEQCGWLKDKFGFSWQIAPTQLDEMLADPDKERSGRVMEAMMKMKKLNLADLENAYNMNEQLA